MVSNWNTRTYVGDAHYRNAVTVIGREDADT